MSNKRKIYTQLEDYDSSSDDEQTAKQLRSASAIPLVSLEGNAFVVNAEALSFLESIDDPLAVIAVAGKYRTGKSFLMNRVLLNIQSGGFSVGGTIQACTKGLWIYTETLSVQGQRKQVLIVDTEGLGAISATDTHDSRVFALALLLSSFFIYNSVGTIDESAINALSLVANMSKHIRAQANAQMDEQATAEELGQYFPDFLWLVRDFGLSLEDEQGRPMSSRQYLEQALAEQSIAGADEESMAAKNRLRRLLRAYFPRRDCATLVRPCTDESMLRQLDKLPDNQLRAEFRKQTAALRQRILESAQPKQVLGKPINGRLLAELCKSFVQALNSGAAPVIRDSWSLLVEVQCREAGERAERYFSEACAARLQREGPYDPKQLEQLGTELQASAVKLFREHCLQGDTEAAQPFELKLLEKLTQLRAALKEQNERALREHIYALVRQLDAQPRAQSLQELQQRIEAAESQLASKVGSSSELRGLWADLMLSQSWLWLNRLWLEKDKNQAMAEQRANDAVERERQMAVAVANAEQNLGSAEQRCESLKLELQELEAQSLTVRETVERGFQQEHDRLAAELLEAKELNATLEGAQAEAASSQSLELVEKAALCERLKLQLEAADQEAVDKQSELDALQQQFHLAMAQAEQAQSNNAALDQAKHQNKQLQAELAAAREQAGDAEQSARQELTKLAQENADALGEIRRIQQQERAEYNRRLQASEQQQAEQGKEVTELKRQLQRTAEELNSAHQKEISSSQRYERELESLRKDAQERTASIKEQQLRYETQLNGARERASTELRELNERIRSDAQRRLQERTDLLKQVTEATTRAAVAELRTETLQNRVTELEKRQATEAQRQQAERTSLELARIEGERKQLEGNNSQLRQSLSEQQQRVLQLEKQIKDQRRDFELARERAKNEYALQMAQSDLARLKQQ